MCVCVSNVRDSRTWVPTFFFHSGGSSPCMCRTSFTDHSSAEYFHSSNCVGTCTDLALKNSCKLQQLHRQNPLQITPPAMLRSTLEEKKKMWTLSLAEVKLRKCVHKDASEWGRTKAYLLRLLHYVREVQSCRGVWSDAQSQGKGLRHADKHSMRLLMDVSGPATPIQLLASIYVHDLRRWSTYLTLHLK